jgi:hypothetical protein
MSNILIACTTCHGLEYRQKVAAQRITWGKDLQGADLKFFYGRPTINGQPYSMGWEDLIKLKQPTPDVVWLDCPDGYKQRKEKMKAIFRWAVDQGYDYVWKIDDDVYLRPERLLAVPQWDYCGLVVNLSYYDEGVEFAHLRAALGACYGLSRRSLECLLGPDTNPKFNLCEDGWVCAQLQDHGIQPVLLNEQMAYTHVKGERGQWLCPSGYEDMICLSAPTPDNKVICSWEYTPTQMLEIHAQFRCAHVGIAVHGTDG